MPHKLGIVGLGAIGLKVASLIDEGRLPGLSLTGVWSSSREKTLRAAESLSCQPAALTPSEMALACDIIVECAPTQAFPGIARPVIEARRTLVTVSGAAILANPELIDLAKTRGARIILATGALLGLDGLRAAAEGCIYSVSIVTRKPPITLAGAPYLTNKGIDVLALNEPKRVFEGTAEEGAAGFPSSVNVAAAVGLAGIGATSTNLEIWADPSVDRNTHVIRVDSDSSRFEMQIENIPSDENPRTGKITALSVIAALRGELESFRVGT
jgi:aspartate dehydrogenase